VDQREIPFHPTFSPAELVCAMAESLAHGEASGDLPEQVARRSPLGPTTRPTVARQVVTVTRAEVVAACRQVVAEVEGRGHLPANVETASGPLGIGQVALLLGRSYLAQARYDRYDRLSVSTGPRYPQLAYELDAWVRRYIGDHWAMPLGFSCESLAEHARLQTWTLKPAWLRPPQGPVAEGEYAGRAAMGGAQP
jgi:hypothetical protein